MFSSSMMPICSDLESPSTTLQGSSKIWAAFAATSLRCPISTVKLSKSSLSGMTVRFCITPFFRMELRQIPQGLPRVIRVRMQLGGVQRQISHCFHASSLQFDVYIVFVCVV